MDERSLSSSRRYAESGVGGGVFFWEASQRLPAF